MEESENIVPWTPLAEQRKPTPKLLPEDWVLEYQVTIQNPSDRRKGLHVVFEEVLTYRVANDAVCKKLAKLSGDSVQRTFKVEGSEWLKSVHEKTFEIYADCEIEHFIFVSDLFLEVLAAGEPRIEEIPLPASFRTKW